MQNRADTTTGGDSFQWRSSGDTVPPSERMLNPSTYKGGFKGHSKGF
jgi:hypothetical protein